MCDKDQTFPICTGLYRGVKEEPRQDSSLGVAQRPTDLFSWEPSVWRGATNLNNRPLRLAYKAKSGLDACSAFYLAAGSYLLQTAAASRGGGGAKRDQVPLHVWPRGDRDWEEKEKDLGWLLDSGGTRHWCHKSGEDPATDRLRNVS